MFGKIKNKLKNVFANSEEIIEENPDEIVEVEEEVKEEKPKKEKKKSIKKEKKEEPEEETIVENNEDEEVQFDEVEEEEPKKKSFLSRVFGSKDEKEEEEIEEIQDEMLENVEEQEKEAIKEKKELSEKEVEENKKKLEKQIEREEVLEEQTVEDMKSSDSVEEKQEDSKGLISKAFGALKKKKITDDDFEKIWIELEMFLLEINIAFEIVERIKEKLQEALIDNSFDRFKLSEKIREVLELEIEEVLKNRQGDFLEVLNDYKQRGELLKILVLGVNGTGKTTSIAKIVNFMQKNDFKLVVAASDTFRAAAVEQLDEHAKKLNFKLIQHKGGSDPAAVAYDAIEHAKAKNLDVVLIDTAGRMPNNSNLMMELQKVKKVSDAQMAIFVGDSISGNDLIDQINLFDKGVEIDGVVLTKVDTDERPGSIVTTAYSIDKPIYFLGIGQEYDDLIKFDAKEVAHKLFSLDDED